MEQLKLFFGDKTTRTILDVGTGTGNFIAVLTEVFSNAKITGVDPNDTSLEEAKETYAEVDFYKMFGENLNFEDDTFEMASISMALHHLPDIGKALNEMQRVVKSGGWVIVNELFSDNLNTAQEVHKQMHHFRSKIDRIKGVSHNETFTRNEIIELVKKSGLDIMLHFEHKKVSHKPTAKAIAERFERMKALLEEIKEQPEYNELAKEIPKIETGLQKHGFEMASCIIIVARVR